jgi:hypothetical protein
MGKGGINLFGSDDRSNMIRLFILYLLTEVIGITAMVLSHIWMSDYHGGFGWETKLVFNYHPVFMTSGMIYLYGNCKCLYLI